MHGPQTFNVRLIKIIPKKNCIDHIQCKLEEECDKCNKWKVATSKFHDCFRKKLTKYNWREIGN
jgi:hypothetical protein